MTIERDDLTIQECALASLIESLEDDIQHFQLRRGKCSHESEDYRFYERKLAWAYWKLEQLSKVENESNFVDGGSFGDGEKVMPHVIKENEISYENETQGYRNHSKG